MSEKTLLPTSALSLPQGGATQQGMGESLTLAGPDGACQLSLPLPLSAGRGYAPSLQLTYSSLQGNGAFGLGWSLSLMSIARRTSKGVPTYDDSDAFIGPDGETLVAERDDAGNVVSRSVSHYGDVTFTESWQVVRYFPRIENGFSRIERWRNASGDFWLIHGTDGQLHCLGKSQRAQLYDSEDPQRIAAWFIEESVAPDGDHLYYQYRHEDGAGITDSAVEQRNQIYLTQVNYAIAQPCADLLLWTDSADSADWHCMLVLDYGERSQDSTLPPPYSASGEWSLRDDPFSRFACGFEVRSWRLCRQILLYHAFSDFPLTLVGRLMFDYQQNAGMSLLSGAQQMGYDTEGLRALPPLDLRYSEFSPTLDADAWTSWTAFNGLDNTLPYQIVDLYGEGLPGILSRDPQGWHYRAPCRAASGTDAVDYIPWQPLPEMPSALNAVGRLMDIDSDGRLDWLIAMPGMAGYFTCQPDGSWSTFCPLSAFPSELFHPQSQWIDLMGGGLCDLALMGPESIRLYPNQRQGFGAALEVAQPSPLPVMGRDARELVAFADVLGSGQPHLVRVRHNEMVVWANLGRGRFAPPRTLATLDFDATSFNPQQLWLVDVNSDGVADLLYVESDRIHIWLNQAGNGFDAPLTLPLPTGVRYDNHCQLSCADLDGQGTLSLLLTVPYPQVSHWRFDFCQQKPWLLNGMNNNMGCDTVLTYRSSAQMWLDEKQQTPGAVSGLPMALPLLQQIQQQDEISGNQRTQQFRYANGFYDGQEREYRGFGYVETRDSAQDSGAEFSPAQRTCSWYHTGREDDENRLYGARYQDPSAFSPAATRLTHFDASTQMDMVLESASSRQRWWLYRALKGCLLRTEVYGLDQPDIPYRVCLYRHQVRLMQDAAMDAPVVFPTQLEQTDYHYERIADDPLIGQQVVLQLDEYGATLWQVTLNYPRRAKPAQSPYPDSLPASAWSASYDEQQQLLRIQELRASVWHLTDPQTWRLALPDAQRKNCLSQPDDAWPQGLHYEDLMLADGVLGDAQPRTFAGQQQVIYFNGTPDFQALIDHLETAELDETALHAWDGVLSADRRDDLLRESGFQQGETLLRTQSETPQSVWVIPHNMTTWFELSRFYHPDSVQANLTVSPVHLSWDVDNCCQNGQTDALKNTTQVAIDYCFLQPWQVTDLNDNQRQVQRDGLGFVVASAILGTEQSGAVGFDSLLETPVSCAITVSELLASRDVLLRQQSRSARDLFSWMPQIALQTLDDAVRTAWLARGWMLADGRLRSHALRHICRSDANPALRELIAQVVRIPPQSATLVADNFPQNNAQQVRASVIYCDGFGRTLQKLTQVPAGDAWQRTDDGELATDDNGALVVVYTETRWVVSGRVEYDNKGLPVRQYQPYFIDSWQYVVDSAMRAYGYADSHYYDAMGREIQVDTASGYQRRTRYYPWFTVTEDENDTQTP